MVHHEHTSNSKCLVALTIAGSDSSGGAGIQADLKTFAAHGCYGTSVLTALTAQNTMGVQGVHGVPPEFVEQQIRSVMDDTEVSAIKTGMLFDTKNTLAVAKTLESIFSSHGHVPLVVDPVCVSTSGHILLETDAIETLINELFPLACIITPNLSEAGVLLSRRGFSSKVEKLGEMVQGAKDLLELGSQAVLLKGGHVTVRLSDLETARAEDPSIAVISDDSFSDDVEILRVSERDPNGVDFVVDVLCQIDGGVTLFPRPRLDSTSTHGTGCTLSAAIACELARGRQLLDAVRYATAYTHLGIETAPPIGKGHGPLNHAHPVLLRPLSIRTAGNPHPLTRLCIQSTAVLWKQYVQHDFVRLLGKGTLPRESFLHFIKQDYLYLKYYARAYAMLAAKSHDFALIKSSSDVLLSIITESSMHASFCKQWGVSDEELRTAPESPATTAYGASLIDTGLRGDTMALTMSLAACLLGYGEVGLWLKREASKPGSWVNWESNPYLRWMEDYSGKEYQDAVRIGIESIESRAAADPPSEVRLEEWKSVWERCVRLEKGFWDMAMTLS
ncbi:hypothetical protein CONPUDRAFT_118575 [Coniophora puteana RWD-64-598 SS2]|uniref:Phosphomethylpyrimidine kinase n=1 Tax=Coniophora puteana (strain RWD-64-598) TaxID=741705 RepID=A0A5M3N2X3_CONPW|nr:uncharacterized protein CONPUDRAFT_118575 [Coniophora puteana RWD-64-598 SS2]EIW85637.1 hypothetical protein CONPUDRAFT_118575 [Coniophora puteana RWD-64-598 SS2]